MHTDLVFLFNGAVDGLLLWITSALQRKPLRYGWRFWLATYSSGLFAVFFCQMDGSWVISWLAKLFVSGLIVHIYFGPCSWRTFSSLLGIFYGACFLSGGVLLTVQYSGLSWHHSLMLASRSPWAWGLVAGLFFIVGGYSRWSLRHLQEIRQLQTWLFPVRVRVLHHTVTCVGLLDTGNRLLDPLSHLPVMVMEASLWRAHLPAEWRSVLSDPQMMKQLRSDWRKRLHFVPYRSTGHQPQWMMTFLPDQVSIQRNGRWHNAPPVLIGMDGTYLASDGAYQAILPLSFLTDGGQSSA